MYEELIEDNFDVHKVMYLNKNLKTHIVEYLGK